MNYILNNKSKIFDKIKLLIFFISLIFSFFPALSAFAQLNLAVVDMQELLDKSETGKAARDQIDRKFKSEKLRIDSLENKIKQARVDLEKQASLMSTKAIREKNEDIFEMEREFQKELSDYSEEYKEANDESIKDILFELEDIFKKYTREGKFKAIIEKDERVVVYSSDKVDITDEVIEELDK